MNLENTINSAESHKNINRGDFIEQLLSQFMPVENAQHLAKDQIALAQIDTFYDLVETLLAQQASASEESQCMSMRNLMDSQAPELVKQFPDEINQVIELIDKLFDYILEQKHLHIEIKMLIGRLRSAFFKLAITDKNLFQQVHNSSRLFLSQMTRIGMLWSQKDPKTFVVKEQITAIIEGIISDAAKVDIRQLFRNGAEQLSLFSMGFIRKTEIFEKRVRESEEAKAKIESARNFAAQSLRKIAKKNDIPNFILHFFKEAWEHIIFLERIKNPDSENYDALLIAKQIVVCLQPIKTEEELVKYLELQALLRGKLEIDLQKSGYTPVETSSFLVQLKDYQDKQIDEAKSAIENENSSEKIIRLKPLVNFESNQPEDDLPAPPINVAEMDLTQWVDFVYGCIPDDPQNVLVNVPDNKSRATTTSESLFQLFEVGRWFEVMLKGISFRCKFAGHIAQNDKFIFVSGSGNKVVEYDGHSLTLALKNKEISPLDESAHFEKAYELVANEAKKIYLKQKREKLLAAQLAAEKVKIDNENKLKAIRTREEIADREAELIKIQNKNILQNIAQLSLGSWVEIIIDNVSHKCRLAAKIASSGKFIFVDRSGVKIAEYLEQQLTELYDTGKIIIKQKNDVFDQALESVISTMRNNKS